MANYRGMSLLADDVKQRCGDATFLRRVHGWLTVGWAGMIPVSAATGLKHSLPFLVAISVYALAVGHFSAWQGTRAEQMADQSTDDDARR